MNRVRELTFKLLDGVPGEAERRELEALVQDPRAAREHIALMDLEGALRAGRGVDITRETMRRILDIEGGTGQRVMDRIKQQRPNWQPRKSSVQKSVSGVSPRVSGSQPRASTRRRARRAVPANFAPWLAAAAAIVLIAGAALYFTGTQKPAFEALATLAQAAPDARIVRDGRALNAAGGEALGAGDQISAGAAVARIAYSDGSSVELAAHASALLGAADETASKQVRLTLGALNARVAKQSGKPFVLTTPHATATVLGTEFGLAIEPNSTRLEVNEGRVRLENAGDGQRVDVGAGFYALAGPGLELAARKIGSDSIVVENLPEVVPTPQAAPLPKFGVVAFHLLDTDTGKRVPGFSPLADGAVLKLSELPKHLTLMVETNPKEVPMLVMDLDGTKNFRREVDPPYSITANWISETTKQEMYSPWTLGPGKHSITATPYSNNRGTGTPGAVKSVQFEIVK